MTPTTTWYLVLAAVLFGVGVVGLHRNRDAIAMDGRLVVFLDKGVVGRGDRDGSGGVGDGGHQQHSTRGPIKSAKCDLTPATCQRLIHSRCLRRRATEAGTESTDYSQS